MAMGTAQITADDCVIPLQHIRDTLVDTKSALPSDKLRLILQHRHEQLRAPWSLARPSPDAASSSDPLAGATLRIGDISLNIEDSTRALAVKLAETAGIPASEAYVVAAGYVANAASARESGAAREEGLLRWYADESLALPEVVQRLVDLAYGDEAEEWKSLGADTQEAYWYDLDAYIQALFKGWAGWAVKPLSVVQRKEHALFWATHQLKLQFRIVDLLFKILYRHNSRLATTSVNLVKAAIMSNFGTEQANVDVWEDDAECKELAVRIRDTLILVAIDSLCLSTVLERGRLAADDREPVTDDDETLLASRDQLTSLHFFLGPVSGDIEDGRGFTASSMVIAAWAAVLRSLPDGLSPSNAGYGDVLWSAMLSRVLAPSAGLLPWVGAIIDGPLLSEQTDSDAAIFRRKVLKDVLVALSELAEHAAIDKVELSRAWSQLFSGGGPMTSLKIASDFWTTDARYMKRCAPLVKSGFPSDPVSLPRLLAGLSGMGSSLATVNEVAGESPVRSAFDCLARPLNLTFPLDTQLLLPDGQDSRGRTRVKPIQSIILPGNAVIRADAEGYVLSNSNGQSLVAWDSSPSGWPLLIEILRVAVGLRGYGDKPLDGRLHLSVAELGIQQSTGSVLAAGMGLLDVVSKHHSGQCDAVLDALRRSGHDDPILVIINLAIGVLTYCADAHELSAHDIAAAVSALGLLSTLSRQYPAYVFPTLRVGHFFDLPTKRTGVACRLARRDAYNEDHDIVLVLLRFMRQLCQTAAQAPEADDVVVKAAIHHVHVDVWQVCGGWRYRNAAVRERLAAEVCGVFETAVSRPFASEGRSLAAASAVADIFVRSASNVTYRPLIEWLVPWGNDSRGETAKQAAGKLLAALLRIAAQLDCPVSQLPFNLLSSAVSISGHKLPLVDVLLGSAVSHASSESACAAMGAVGTWLDLTAAAHGRPSLVSLLADARTAIDALSSQAVSGNPRERLAAWKLLLSIAITQPGAHVFCIGSRELPSPAIIGAVDEIKAWRDSVATTPDVLSVALAFLEVALNAPAGHAVFTPLHMDDTLWQAVFDIVQRPVPTPPTFTLSRDSADFAVRITDYAHETQARANATALFAAELEALTGLEEDGPEPTARKLVTELCRNGGKLSEQAVAILRSSCDPDLHVGEMSRLREMGVDLERWRTIKQPRETRYGIGYLYDGEPQLASPLHQSAVNFSLDMLNLNWSQLDADIALTKAWHRFAEAASRWTEGDGLAGKAALRAATDAVHVVAEEDRPGDVMAAAQVERLWVVATLLDTALDSSTDADDRSVDNLASGVRRVIENPTLSPSLSVRNPQIPAVHRPLLHILHLLLRSLAARPHLSAATETFIEVAGRYVLDAADHMFDIVSKQSDAAADLVLTMAPLIELVRTRTSVWVNKLSESNLVGRSLLLVKRLSIKDGRVPAHIPSILLFHLALANHSRAAERLAVAGVLSAYQDNVVAIEAEYGRISPTSDEFAVHGAWCGMLAVIKSLLTTLPNSAGFAESDVIPFVRLTMGQLQGALAWPMDGQLLPARLHEMRLASELLLALSTAFGLDASQLLPDFGEALLMLLYRARDALEHPRTFAASIIPVSEVEQVELNEELQRHVVSEEDTVLVLFKQTPVLAGRVHTVVQIAHTAVLCLVACTAAWQVMSGHCEPRDDLVLYLDDDAPPSAQEPISIINDVQIHVTKIASRLDAAYEPDAELLRTSHRVAESAALLSCAQILVRRVLLPAHAQRGDEEDMVLDVKPGTRRQSLAQGHGHGHGQGEPEQEARKLRDLVQMWRETMNGPKAIGERRFGRWLEKGLDRTLEELGEEE